MPLQKSFRGLSNLLGMYQAGEVTAEYGGIITPTFDVMQFLQPPEWIVGDLSVVNPNDEQNIAMDPATRYLLHHVGWETQSIVNVAEAFISMGASYLTPQGKKVDLTPSRTRTLTGTSMAAQIDGDSVYFANGLFLEAGGTLRFYNKLKTGAGTTVYNYGFLVTKIPV